MSEFITTLLVLLTVAFIAYPFFGRGPARTAKARASPQPEARMLDDDIEKQVRKARQRKRRKH